MKHKIILLTIIVVASFLRLVKLGEMPNSYTPDELAQGYTAYSILKTGKDEWGSNNLLSFRSFGDYKPPLQTLFMVPSIKLFGLTPFAIRLPNALFSILTIVLVYLITVHLFQKKSIALLASLFMAVSPWSLPMSRIALEANLIVFIISLAVFLFLKAVSQKNYFIFCLSFLVFGLSFFTYHSAKIFTPLLILGLIIYKKIYKQKIFLIISLILSSFIFLFYFQSINQVKSSRTNDIAIFNPTDKWRGVSDNQFEMTQNGLPYIIVKTFYNKIVYLGEVFSQSYLSYFSPQFLITSGAGETTYGMLPNFGVLGIVPFIGLLLSLFLLLKNKDKNTNQSLLFLFFVILIPPLVASVAKGQYSANRVSLMMPFIQIIASVGIILFVEKINLYKKTIIFITSGIFIFTTFIFLQRYFFQGDQILAKGMLYGHQQAINFVKNNPQIDTIIYSRKLSEPQAYVSFFEKIDPKITQSESPNWLKYQSDGLPFLDMLGEYNLGKYIFREINPPSDRKIPNAIIIGRPEEFRDLKPTFVIHYPSVIDPPESIYIYQTEP